MKAAKPIPDLSAELIAAWGGEVRAQTNTKADLSLSLLAHCIFKELFQRANRGNEDAKKSLHDILAENVSQFDKFCHLDAGFYGDIARKKTTWPGLLSIDKDVVRKNSELITLLGLGNESDLNYQPGKKQWTRDKFQNKIAERLFKIINDFRLRLPYRKSSGKYINKESEIFCKSKDLARKLEPLRRSNSGQWWEAAEPLLELLYGTNFQDHPDFAAMYPENAENLKEAGKHGLIFAAWRKGRIKTAIQQSFKIIARKS